MDANADRGGVHEKIVKAKRVKTSLQHFLDETSMLGKPFSTMFGQAKHLVGMAIVEHDTPWSWQKLTLDP